MVSTFINKVWFRLKYPFKDSNHNIITLYRNWYIYFLDYIFFLRNNIVICEFRNKIKFAFRLNTFDLVILNEVFIIGQYNLPLLHIQKNSTVIDVGAHIGSFTILVAKHASRVKVYSYEPFEANFNLLTDNIKLNKLTRHVQCFKKGVGARRVKKKLYIHSKNTGGHSMYVRSQEYTLIELVTLKDIFIQHNIQVCDVLKMDCEGAEYEILYETPISYLKKIRSITLEYHANKSVVRLKKFLEEKGFNVRLEENGIPILYAERK